MIDFSRISSALEIYKFWDYKEIDVPWIVQPEITNLTIPLTCKAYSTIGGDLVGSGEQSFMQMMKDGNLHEGKYSCCTPCFRDEKILNKFTKNYFLKVELIHFGTNIREIDALEMAGKALRYMSHYMPCAIIQQKEGDNLWDIIAIHNGIELGSYGVRQRNGFTWAYGTGLAEPRFSACFKEYTNLTSNERQVKYEIQK